MKQPIRKETSEVSVVIPTYNSAPWLASTLESLEKSLIRTRWKAEIVIVDDGSTDGSLELLKFIKLSYSYPINIITQSNQGRFLARWNGANAAIYPNLLFLDSRILLGENSLNFVDETGLNPPGTQPRVWNGHSITDPKANLVGHFWEVPTFIFWGSYLSRPGQTRITSKNFNSVPKGTTFFICPKELFIEASQQNWPGENAKLTNDDTKIIRYIVSKADVLLDPNFWALYRPRATIRAFIRHTYDRGTTFVDGFAGISTKVNLLILLAAISPVAIIAITSWLLISANLILLGLFSAAFVLTLLMPAIFAAINSCPWKGICAYLLLATVFAVPYWAGIVRGIRLHGSALFQVKEGKLWAKNR